jgi:hypothetical protein
MSVSFFKKILLKIGEFKLTAKGKDKGQYSYAAWKSEISFPKHMKITSINRLLPAPVIINQQILKQCNNGSNSGHYIGKGGPFQGVFCLWMLLGGGSIGVSEPNQGPAACVKLNG